MLNVAYTYPGSGKTQHRPFRKYEHAHEWGLEMIEKGFDIKTVDGQGAVVHIFNHAQLDEWNRWVDSVFNRIHGVSP